MKALIFGKTGQVARELARLLPDAVFLGRDQADLGVPGMCEAAIAAHPSDVIINAAAYTAVDKAESESDLAHAVNGAAPAEMARAAAAQGVPLVHISTDYVFDGGGEAPWKPDDETGPLGVYGASKLAGEQGVRAAGGVHAILRTSWVFSAHGANFVKTMRRLSGTHDQLRVVADQIGGPTAAADIAAAAVRMAQVLNSTPEQTGTYHFSGFPETSWSDFAREIFSQLGTGTTVEDIPSADYPTPAARPFNSRMDCSSLRASFGIHRPDWRNSLRDVIAELEST
ncbi:dTDP-4-dehydrorhamnose reductase [Pontivivens nitratireducens]|uniref:dTDP-4-dehydrorhamnose reductase n=1 Tax=Pontivivens nitratireducens TaxID=2758038 RepID=A0A6G7VQZ2_9RHOB|nr:dTDP-4-dehydrorhamnose reductase [Pontibrevibacter nitratireducens]QIK42340.1 dTDP-4-dehydrorhamnose reductase [Pontibrevibacter nitratireducens]